ncbi:hypothetical protein C8J57DRAFT_1554948 [Mycena rebaudengoi]|nr:hypothetical protein C8J57DRAFT_1554948 [Mycena rebaudengoi]
MDVDEKDPSEYPEEPDEKDPSECPEKPMEPAPTFRKHPHFWFLDDTIFLQLHGVRYRLNNRQLATFGAFFEGLFLQRAIDSQSENLVIKVETGDDAPNLVEIHVEEANGVDLYNFDQTGMSLDELEELLKLMRYIENDKITFKELAAVLQGSKTLRCADISSWAISRLQQRWREPTLLARISDAEESIRLARRYSIPEIIPRALFEYFREKTIADGPESDPILDEACTKFSQLWMGIRNFPGISIDCPLPSDAQETCASNLNLESAHHKNVINTALDSENYPWDPISGFQKMIKLDDNAPYCHACVIMRQAAWNVVQEELVEELTDWLAEIAKFY